MLTDPNTDHPKSAVVTDSMPLSIHTDQISTKDGIVSIPVSAAKEMVYDYGEHKLLRIADELESAAQFADGIPVTRGHPASGVVTDRNEILGSFRSPVVEDGILKGILAISDKDFAADITSGKLTDVSPGFFCNIDFTPGTFNDSTYDGVQRDVFFNHVAVVDKGRCSIEDGCGVHIDSVLNTTDSPPDLIGKLDTAIGMAGAEYGNNNLKDLLVEIKEIVTMVLYSTDSVALAKVTDSIEAITKERDSMKDEHTILTDAISTITAELDSLKGDHAQLGDKHTELARTLDSTTKERDTLRTSLDAIHTAERDALITELITLQDAKSSEDLQHLKLDELKKELEMVNELKTRHLTFRNDRAGKAASIVDAAYANIGK